MKKVHTHKRELKAEIDRLSRWLAFGRYKKQNPGCSDEAASQYAHRFHLQFVEAAIDVIIAGGDCSSN